MEMYSSLSLLRLVLGLNLMIGLALVVGVCSGGKYSRRDFPPNFVFGSGTSAYQVSKYMLSSSFFQTLKPNTNCWLLHQRWKEQQTKMAEHPAFGTPLLMLVSSLDVPSLSSSFCWFLIVFFLLFLRYLRANICFLASFFVHVCISKRFVLNYLLDVKWSI